MSELLNPKALPFSQLSTSQSDLEGLSHWLAPEASAWGVDNRLAGMFAPIMLSVCAIDYDASANREALKVAAFRAGKGA
mgnify:CR=1 FL=1